MCTMHAAAYAIDEFAYFFLVFMCNVLLLYVKYELPSTQNNDSTVFVHIDRNMGRFSAVLTKVFILS